MTISERVKNINPSQTLAITAQALKMKREGKKVISFAAGEPDFGTPENIREKAISAIREGFSHYTASSGIIELKEAILEKLKKDNEIEYKTSEIIVLKRHCFAPVDTIISEVLYSISLSFLSFSNIASLSSIIPELAV